MGPFSGGPQAGPTGTFDGLRIDVNFSLSPQDSASLTGRFDVNFTTAAQAFPEPGTLATLAGGALPVLGFLGCARRRRKAAAA